MVEWKQFYSHKGIDYYVSNMGDVKSLRKVVQTRRPLTYRVREKTLTRHSTLKRATLYIGEVRFDVAELVATHFLENPFNCKSVKFIDDDQQNCKVCNLMWYNPSPEQSDGEIWKDIEGYIGIYQVSNHGNVRSLRFARKKDAVKVLKPILSSSGYYVVTLCGKQTRIHRLVASAFCDNPNGYDVVDHIDTDPTNNKAENLRWTTQRGNILNPISHKKRMDRIRESIPRKCVQMDLDGNLIKIWNSLKDACVSLGLGRGNLTSTCQGKYQTCGGYKWAYYDVQSGQSSG